jgi:hypothetical protein
MRPCAPANCFMTPVVPRRNAGKRQKLLSGRKESKARYSLSGSGLRNDLHGVAGIYFGGYFRGLTISTASEPPASPVLPPERRVLQARDGQEVTRGSVAEPRWCPTDFNLHRQNHAELCIAAHHSRVSLCRFCERVFFDHRTYPAQLREA